MLSQGIHIVAIRYDVYTITYNNDFRVEQNIMEYCITANFGVVLIWPNGQKTFGNWH